MRPAERPDGPQRMTGPRSDVVDEAQRLIAAATERSILVRFVGGVAVRLLIPDLPAVLQREYKDIDIVTSAADGSKVESFLAAAGYEPDTEFNTLNGYRRLLFYDDPNRRRVDVFVGSFAMCHSIPMEGRLTASSPTIPLAELLLTKLQIVELTTKDLVDIAALLLRFGLSDEDGAGINVMRIAQLAGADWGLWRTIKLNHERVRERLPTLGLGDADVAAVSERLDGIWRAVDTAPKGLRWKLRDRVGDRVRWYEEPDEVE